MKQLITDFAKKENIPLDGAKAAATVLLGRDTRPSGESLLEAANKVRHRLKLKFGSKSRKSGLSLMVNNNNHSLMNREL